MAEHERDVNAPYAWCVTAPKDVDDLLSAPLLGLLTEPMTAHEVSGYLSGDGLELTAIRAGDLLARLEALGLARVAGYEGPRRATSQPRSGSAPRRRWSPRTLRCGSAWKSSSGCGATCSPP
jgi:hypothetical protein